MGTSYIFARIWRKRNKFQFPTNGKAHGNLKKLKAFDVVGKCFNSLQTGKHMGTSALILPNSLRDQISFNSLQTGKHMGTLEAYKKSRKDSWKFQFPTNGKAHGNFTIGEIASMPPGVVSIPYKRESTWERTCCLDALFMFRVKFQFPTNGKAHGNLMWTREKIGLMCTSCFNSLQTGKHMGTSLLRLPWISLKWSLFQFPTNGKAHGNHIDIDTLRGTS